MHAGPISNLSDFNGLVFQCQDEAYTVAYYMYGNEGQAAQIVQQAFQQAYRQYKGTTASFRIQVLHLVSSGCLASPCVDTGNPSRSEDVRRQLLVLPGEERLVIVLVDILGLGYQETAGIMRQPAHLVTKLLARGRAKLANALK